MTGRDNSMTALLPRRGSAWMEMNAVEVTLSLALLLE